MLRSRHIISGLVLAAVVAASSLSGPAGAQTPPPNSYLKTFDNYLVDHPTPFVSDATLDVLVHSRDNTTWGALEGMRTDHGAHCEGPPSTRDLQPTMAYEDAAFLCSANPHLMTAISAGGYGVIYLTPNHQVDFSSGEAVIRFDVSTLRTSTRDWIDLWVTPMADNITAPFDQGDVDLQGAPKRAIHLGMGTFNSGSTFGATRTDNFVTAGLPSCWWCRYEDTLATSASRRDTFELRISSTHVKFWMPQYGITWVDTTLATPLDWDRGIVQLGHHSYNPAKDCNTANTPGPDGTCRANTWHWDNISISPSVPFTMIHATERAALEASSGSAMTFTFPQPAPENAYLRANVRAADPQVSVDGGTTWATLTRQPAQRSEPDGGVFEPYWHAIPAGTQSVKIRATRSGWWGQAAVNSASIWSVAQGPPPQPTGVPPTATVAPPTDTPTPVPQDTPTPLPTFTPVPPTATSIPPSSTPVPSTATPMPSVGCVVTVARDGTPEATWRCD